MSSGRVLSIQSHVVHGYVGNRAAVFPLQLLDFEVDFVNSVQFSNHVGYQTFKGDRFSSKQLSDLYEGLSANSLLNYSHLLTGYVGEESFMNKIGDIVDDLKQKNPSLVYLCDPVLGDNGQWYVPKSLLAVLKERLLKHADVITPNLFEIEKIYGQDIKTRGDLFNAIKYCHDAFGIKSVVISSCGKLDDSGSDDNLDLYASSISDDKIIHIQFDRLPGSFSGTGDTFAAMLLAWLTKLNGDLKGACEHSTSAMLHILKRTLAIGQELSQKGYANKADLAEIKLVQSKRDIEAPEIVVRAELIDFNKH